jgi:hypothetical protein
MAPAVTAVRDEGKGNRCITPSIRLLQPKPLGGPKIHDELKLRRVLHRQVTGLGTSQYTINIARPSLNWFIGSKPYDIRP